MKTTTKPQAAARVDDDAEQAAARTDISPVVRRVVAQADRAAGRDLAWARADSDTLVRWEAALADRKAGRDMSWARADADADVRLAAAQ